MTCSLCVGSGHQLAWLTYSQRSKWITSVEPTSPIVHAHPQLRETRFLRERELSAFSMLVFEEADGPVELKGYRGGDSVVLRNVVTSLDPRLERINRQQYIRFAVVRRDARFEMCGTSGTLVLSGNDLVGARVSSAMHPIRLRLWCWGGAVLAAGCVAMIVADVLRGSSVYFARTNAWVSFLALFAVAFLVPLLGGVLRSLQPGFRFAKLKALEKYSGLAAGVTLVGMCVLGFAARPRLGEASAALSIGDVARARVVLNALNETTGPSPEVLDVEDAVRIAEAAKLGLEDRLKLLDLVAARGAGHASEARAEARKARVTEIHRLVDVKTPDAAVTAVDRWFPQWRTDADIAEERARAHEAAGTLCSDDPCRFAKAKASADDAMTPERSQRAADLKRHLLEVLAIGDVANEETLPRVRRLGVVQGNAVKTLEVAGDDVELGDQAKKAKTWAETERAKVPLLGSKQPVLEELLGAVGTTEITSTWIEVDGTRVYLSLDGEKKCRGLYVIGATKANRMIAGKIWPAERLLSQAIGHVAIIKTPTDSSSVARWWDGASIVARWNSGRLTELRIGDATP